jgi:hypothetical protein
MAPSAPSLTSQARAAELNAATAARARSLKSMNAELADMSELPSSQPFSLADFTMRNKASRQSKPYHTGKIENYEQFNRPNRPVDRYFPPVAQSVGQPVAQPVAQPVSLHPYPQQYADPRLTMYNAGPYPVQEYYYPVYQGVSSYQQVYPNHGTFSVAPPGIPIVAQSVVGHPSAASSGIPTATPPVVAPPAALSQATLFSVAPPAVPRTAIPVAPPATPQVAPPVTPEKKPTAAKKATPKSSPSKAVDEEDTLTFFRPQDLSPSKWEEDLIRFKAAIANEEQTDNTMKQHAGSEEKSAWVNGDSDHQKGGPKFDGSNGKATPMEKHSNGIQNSHHSLQHSIGSSSSISLKETTRPVRRNDGTSKLELEHPFSSQVPQKSPQRDQLAAKEFLYSGQKIFESDSPSLTDDKPVFSTNGNFPITEQQQPMLDSGESRGVNVSQNDYTSLFPMPLVEPYVSGTPPFAPKRLQSPFQHRDFPHVKYYKPIVNKYPKNVFASEESRLEALRSIDNDSTWREFQRKPRVEGLPGPFKGFPSFPVPTDHSPSLTSNGTVMPPPGLAASDPLLTARPVPWKAKTGDASKYYERVLEAEDWFHQSISREDHFSNKFQRKLDEERAMLYIANGQPHDLTTPAMASQTTNAFKLALGHLSTYVDSEEDKKLPFGFDGRGRSVRRRAFTPDDDLGSGDFDSSDLGSGDLGSGDPKISI